MLTIPGVTISKANRLTYCLIDNFSDELKQLIRDQLSGVWSGFAEVEDLPDIYSYKRTLNSFLDRYNGKNESTKKGMIGELLSHILINNIIEEFQSLSVLKNKEERSIKKGFDIIYFEELSDKIWYSEVKAGRGSTGTSSEYNSILLERAHTSITEMFSAQRSSLWDSALVDVKLTVKGDKGKIKLSKLLDQDSPIHKTNLKKNVVLVSVLYRCPTQPIDMNSISNFFDTVVAKSTYLDVILFSVQKKMFELVGQFLESEAI